MNTVHKQMDMEDYVALFWFFLRNTVQTQTLTNINILSPWIHARNPISISTSKRFSRQILHLAIEGHTSYHTIERIALVKSWNKSRKMRTPVPSRGLKPWWIGSTTKNLTSWVTLSSLWFLLLHIVVINPGTTGVDRCIYSILNYCMLLKIKGTYCINI